MSAMSLDVISARQRRVFLWRQMKHGPAEWRRRARSRNQLVNLSDRTLQDIGISRCMAHWEACKPFWMP